ncbi:MAG: 4-hydroxythreonine-4-phosphate dehydrogenase PdxA, partial [Leptospira sp.]|nr:4-hydroxythreonine-4-phosphate dehydrogenase PdxA [Leptospira sp.]
MGEGPLFISEGDPVGISPELLHKEWKTLKKTANKRAVFLVTSSIHDYQNTIKISLRDLSLGKLDIEKISGIYEIVSDRYSKSVNSNLKGNESIKLGKPSAISGGFSFESLKIASSCIKKFGGGLITLPLSKEWVIASGNKNFTGHTEFLSQYFGKPTFMLMHGKKWNVIPLTTHIPLKKVSSQLKKINWVDLKKSIIQCKLWKSEIKIGFLGLNPHAGEGGKIGKEEIEILNPIMKNWNSGRIKAIGPLSADSAFIGKKPACDLYLAGFHDQGLIPFKILEGKAGINVTLGLDFFRVSPDHGTAY